MNLIPNTTPLTAWSASTCGEDGRLIARPVVGWAPDPNDPSAHLPVCVAGHIARPLQVAFILPTGGHPGAEHLAPLAGTLRTQARRELEGDPCTAAMLAAGPGIHRLSSLERFFDGGNVADVLEFLDDIEAEVDFALAGVELIVDSEAGTYTLRRWAESGGETPAVRRARALLERTTGGPL
ncbi:hypothetical protein GCM10023153_24680 [Ornithinibacter aureus]|uniref:Uncharacterized protein n=1 Tax=Ornithinibacter aureus TaxID=622664 RepID=A0ABP8K118_9MICO|nr:hypothetical protein [Ornithinibacter aureus]KAF0833078.1 hypothetical protein C8E84_0850 [Ornithinibacter aureus]